MRVAALYDIRGNPAALEAVLAHTADADADAIVIGATSPADRSRPRSSTAWRSWASAGGG